MKEESIGWLEENPIPPEELARIEAAEKRLEEYVLEPAPFQCINFPEWEKWTSRNKDSYGKACLVFAAEWAKNMETLIFKNGSEKGFLALSEIEIEESSKKADDIALGVTGFMYGVAIDILSRTWRYGKMLQNWHNAKYGQPGIEGTVNPAIVTVEV